jgi:hypothetical protein
MMPGDKYSGGLPYVTTPADIDHWPSAAASALTLDTIIEIINRGYEGVSIQYSSLSGDRTLISVPTDPNTPEGRLTQELLMFAQAGKSQPVATSLSILERIYREQGLQLPQKQKADAPTSALNGKNTQYE